MTNKEKRRFSARRLLDLKDQAIVLDIETMDVEDNLALYDSIFHLFCKGELDNHFESYVFDELTEDERINLIDLVSEYRGLCFYKGSGEYWLDSLDGYAVSDNEIITYAIFDNYDFLLDLGKKGGRRVLNQVDAFFDSDYVNSSVIEYLRRSNASDEIVEEILIDMSKEDSLYNIFTNEQKAVLLGNPFGNLYDYGENGVVIKSPIDIAIGLYKIITGNDVVIIEENKEDVVRGLREFLLTADIDQSVIDTSDNYGMDMYRNDVSKDIESFQRDNKHDSLRTLMLEFAPDYGEDENVMVL